MGRYNIPGEPGAPASHRERLGWDKLDVGNFITIPAGDPSLASIRPAVLLHGRARGERYATRTQADGSLRVYRVTDGDYTATPRKAAKQPSPEPQAPAQTLPELIASLGLPPQWADMDHDPCGQNAWFDGMEAGSSYPTVLGPTYQEVGQEVQRQNCRCSGKRFVVVSDAGVTPIVIKREK